MGKISPKGSMTLKHKWEKNSRNKYLRPGALAQLRYNRAALKSFANIGKKRIRVINSDDAKDDLWITTKTAKNSRTLSSKLAVCSPMVELPNVRSKSLPGTPTIINSLDFDSRLESLPLDILVKILCHLHHDQLRAVILVSKRMTNAVLLAKEWHFNYKTPDRQGILRAKKMLFSEQEPSVSSIDGKFTWASVPCTPKAPKQGRRLSSSINMKDIQQLTVGLFHESAFSSSYIMRCGLPRPNCKSLAPSRVLFYEDELCRAVAQNKL